MGTQASYLICTPLALDYRVQSIRFIMRCIPLSTWEGVTLRIGCQLLLCAGGGIDKHSLQQQDGCYPLSITLDLPHALKVSCGIHKQAGMYSIHTHQDELWCCAWKTEGLGCTVFNKQHQGKCALQVLGG
jgi:hypothetical protein